MKISGNEEIAKYVNDMSANRSSEVTDNASKTGETPGQPKEDAIVSLSKASKEVQMARNAMESEPDIRLEKVQGISERINSGSYEVNHEKTAEKMMSIFIDEMA